MKYIVQVEIAPGAGAALEANPAKIQALMGNWQALNPLGMYFSMTRRAVTIIVDVANEDAMFEALHTTWVVADAYPSVWPVADFQEFPQLLQRAGVGA